MPIRIAQLEPGLEYAEARRLVLGVNEYITAVNYDANTGAVTVRFNEPPKPEPVQIPDGKSEIFETEVLSKLGTLSVNLRAVALDLDKITPADAVIAPLALLSEPAPEPAPAPAPGFFARLFGA